MVTQTSNVGNLLQGGSGVALQNAPNPQQVSVNPQPAVAPQAQPQLKVASAPQQPALNVTTADGQLTDEQRKALGQRMVSQIYQARSQNVSDDDILNGVQQRLNEKYPNSPITGAVQQAKSAGLQSSDIIDEIIKQNTQTSQPEGKSLSGFGGNVLNSAGQAVSGLADTVLHPINTLENLGKIAGGAVEKLIPGNPNLGNFDYRSNADAVGKFYKDRYGGLSNIENTLYNDPIGSALDLSAILDAGGSAVSKLGDVSKIEDMAKAGEAVKNAGEIVNPLIAPSKVANGILKTPIGDALRTKAGDIAASMEANNLRLSPLQKSKLAQDAGVATTAEDGSSSFDRTNKIADNQLVRYGAEQKIVGNPQNRLAKINDIVDQKENQLSSFLKSNPIEVDKNQVIQKLEQIPQQYRSQPLVYQAAKSQVQGVIDHLNDPTLKFGDKIPLKDINNFKRDAWNASKFDSATTNTSRQLANDMGDVYKNIIEDTLDKTGATINGQKIHDFNQDYGKALGYQKLVSRAVGRSETGLLGKGVETFVGSKIGQTVGGVPGELAGAYLGSKAGDTIAGTNIRSRIGAGLQNFSQKEPITSLPRTAQIDAIKKSLGPIYNPKNLPRNIQLNRSQRSE